MENISFCNFYETSTVYSVYCNCTSGHNDLYIYLITDNHNVTEFIGVKDTTDVFVSSDWHHNYVY